MLSLLYTLTAHASRINAIEYLQLKPYPEEGIVKADGFCRFRRVWLHMEAPLPDWLTAPICLHKFQFFGQLKTIAKEDVVVEPVIQAGKNGEQLISKLIIKLPKGRIEYQAVDPVLVNFLAPTSNKSVWEATASLTAADVEEFKKVLNLQNIMLRGKDGTPGKTPHICLTTDQGSLTARFSYLDSTTELVLTDTLEGDIGSTGIDLDASEFALLLEIVKSDGEGVIRLSNAQIQIITQDEGVTCYLNTRRVQTKGNSYAAN